MEVAEEVMEVQEEAVLVKIVQIYGVSFCTLINFFLHSSLSKKTVLPL